jgi:hypothetical protein
MLGHGFIETIQLQQVLPAKETIQAQGLRILNNVDGYKKLAIFEKSV